MTPRVATTSGSCRRTAAIRAGLTKEKFRLLNNPWWSPDGTYIAARKHFTTGRSLGTGEIWIYHRNGGSGVAVVERPNESHQKELGEPGLFAGRPLYIYYSLDSTPGGSFQYAQDSNGANLRDPAPRPADRSNRKRCGRSRWRCSANAPRLTVDISHSYGVYVRKSALFLKDLVSGEERAIYKDLDQDVQEVWAVHGVYPNMDWDAGLQEHRVLGRWPHKAY